MKQALGIFLLFLWSLVGLAQETSVTGKVAEASDGSPIPGASVQIKGTTVGNITNIDGVYQINAKMGDVLVFSFIGMKTIEMPVTGAVLNASLAADVTDLDDVVVVGYGVKKKSLITGATSSVSAKEMSSSVTRAELALQGKAPGVSVTANSGSPGNGMKVRIRGAGSNGKSEPLYIVDGMKAGDINYLAPGDIESMEVLKDAASSAIYGAEGANGVVIIKTKSGQKGEGRIDYDFQYGFQSMPKSMDMMNASQYSTYMNEILDKDGKKLSGVPALTSENGTNWLNEVGETAPMSSHHLSFSGGTDKSSYLISGGYDSQDGIIGGDHANFERITARINLTHEVKKWCEVGANVAYTNSNRSSITEDDGFNGVVNSAIQMDPTTKPFYSSPTSYMQNLILGGTQLSRAANGDYYGISDNGFVSGEVYNPLLFIQNMKGQTVDNKILGSTYVKLMPFEGFSFTSRAGMDLAFQNYNTWNPSYYGNDRAKSQDASIVTSNDKKWSTWLWENFASYSKKFDDHSFTLMAGVSAQEYNYINLNTSAGLMIQENERYRYPDYVTSRAKDIVGGGRTKTTMASTFGRLSYDFKNKYMLEATMRQDGSSLFGPDNKYGYFPSLSAGWTFSQEEFWSGLEAINFGKLRASWGQNGSISNLEPDQYRSLITTIGVEYPDGNGVLQPGAEADLIAYPKLRWEASEQIDLGLDLRALNGMIYFSFDAYRKVTKDLLTPASGALSLGNDFPFANAGEVTNSGLEFLIGVQDSKTDFTYDVNLNLTTLKNEVTYMTEGTTRLDGAALPTVGVITYMEKGQPIYYYRGYKTNGINATTGEPIIVDVNGDGVTDEKDRTNIGSPHPDLMLGVNVNLGYKGFDFNMFGQGAFGQENYIGFMRADNTSYNKLAKFYEGRWTPTNTNASMPKAGFAGNTFYNSDLMVEDASYFKIRQIQLGYTLPKKISQKAHLVKARLYASLNDYFTFTSYSGFDPEVGSGNNNAQGVDFGIYPVSKKLLFGLNITF